MLRLPQRYFIKTLILLGALSLASQVAEPYTLRTEKEISLDVAKNILEDALKSQDVVKSNGGQKYGDFPVEEAPKSSSSELEDFLDAAIREIENEYDTDKDDIVATPGKDENKITVKKEFLVIPDKQPVGRSSKKKVRGKKRKLSKGVLEKPLHHKIIHHKHSDTIPETNSRGHGSLEDETQIFRWRDPARRNNDFLPYKSDYQLPRPRFRPREKLEEGENDRPYSSKIFKAFKNLFHDDNDPNIVERMQEPTMRLTAEDYVDKEREREDVFRGYNERLSREPKFNDIYQVLRQRDELDRDMPSNNPIVHFDDTERRYVPSIQDGTRELDDTPELSQRGHQQKGNQGRKTVADEFEELATALEDEIYRNNAPKSHSDEGLPANSLVSHKQDKISQKGQRKERPKTSDSNEVELIKSKNKNLKTALKGPERYDVMQKSGRSGGLKSPKARAQSFHRSDTVTLTNNKSNLKLLKQAVASKDDFSAETREANMIDEIEARVAELQKEIDAKRGAESGYGRRKRLRM